MVKIDILVQARMGSSRLPGKVLKRVGDKSFLFFMVERLRNQQVHPCVNNICVITSTLSQDDPIVEECKKIDVRYFRGHPTDLVSRHYAAALELQSEAVCKIPSDCPLTCAEVNNQVIRSFCEGGHDFVSNIHPATFPDGLDIEVFGFDALEMTFKEATLDYQREHTTAFMWDANPDFSCSNVTNPLGDMSMTHRWTLDYREDLEFLRSLIEKLGFSTTVSFQDILSCLDNDKELQELNSKYLGVNWYRHHAQVLKTVKNSEWRVIEDET